MKFTLIVLKKILIDAVSYRIYTGIISGDDIRRIIVFPITHILGVTEIISSISFVETYIGRIIHI